jgi:tRNA(fMet)-specific endonuclease VapC
MATSHLVIDSDIVISFLRRKSNALLEAITYFNCHLTAITVYEIEVTAIKSERQVEQFRQVLQWLTVLPLDVIAAREAAAIQRTLQQQGQIIGLPDTLIAGICLVQQMPLLTRNTRHYQRVAGLQVVTPPELATLY